MDERITTSDRPDWRDCDLHTPPKNTKILILTRWGVIHLGTWDDEARFVAWMPLPKIPHDIKEKMRRMQGIS